MWVIAIKNIKLNYPPNNNCQIRVNRNINQIIFRIHLKSEVLLVLVEHPECKTSDRYPGPVGRKFGRIDLPSMAQEE